MPVRTDRVDPLLDDPTRDAAARAAEHAALAAEAAADALAGVAVTLSGAAAEIGSAAYAAGREAAGDALAAVRSGALGEALEDALGEARGRGVDAWDALRGRRARRWPWATGSALGGAVAAVAVVLLVRRLLSPDAPGAQEPEDVRAVVDPAPPVPVEVPVEVVDEDGEAHP